MRSRYFDSQIVKTDTGKPVYQSTIYPEIDVNDDDLYIMTYETERLDILAKNYYDEPSYWWIIANANHLPKDSIYVKENVQLRIPNIQYINKIFSDLQSLNNNTY